MLVVARREEIIKKDIEFLQGRFRKPPWVARRALREKYTPEENIIFCSLCVIKYETHSIFKVSFRWVKHTVETESN